MLNQTFTAKQFKYVFQKRDLLHLRATNSHTKIEDIYEEAESKFKQIKNCTKSLDNFYKTIINSCEVYVPVNIIDQYLIRKLDHNLIKIQKPKYSNRNIIVNNIKLILNEEYNYKILKLDIKSMYESIGWDDCIAKTLKSSKIIDKNNFVILNSIKKTMSKHLRDGEKLSLIRGLSTSALLSDLYMRKLDRFIKQNNNVYYYARYVDDIIIFMFRTADENKLKKEIKQELDKLNLKLNHDKTQVINHDKTQVISNKSNTEYTFDYLGYTFMIQYKQLKTNQQCKSNKKLKTKKQLKTTISKKKINKVKRKFYKIFEDFEKTYSNNPNKSLQLLRQRIKFITCAQIFKVKRYGEHKTVYNSFINNYYYADEDNKESVLKELDINLAYYLNKHKDKEGIRIIKYFNFFHAKENKIKIKYSVKLIKKIRRCWYYG